MVAGGDKVGPLEVTFMFSYSSWPCVLCISFVLVKCTIPEDDLIASNKCPVFF